MMKILVTGSNGLLGQKITAQFLQERDIELLATSRGPNRYGEKRGYEYIDLDITDSAAVYQVVKQAQPHCIINTAAMANPDQCEKEMLACDRINTTAVENLVHICEEQGIHLIHISTDFIFDGREGPYTEEAIPNPLSYYGRSKLAAEQAVQQGKCRWTILRTVLVYGVLKNMSRGNIVLWVKSSLEQQRNIRVVNDQWRTPTLAEDLAAGCLLTAKKGATGIYHLSGSEMLSIFEIAQKVAGFWKLNAALMTPVASLALNEPAQRPAHTGFIITKAVTELGFRPRDFDSGLAIVNAQLSENAAVR